VCTFHELLPVCVQSITILHGPINVLNEDAHVVHHQYPGAHWTQHPDLMRKHTPSYTSGQGSIFVGERAGLNRLDLSCSEG